MEFKCCTIFKSHTGTHHAWVKGLIRNFNLKLLNILAGIKIIVTLPAVDGNCTHRLDGVNVEDNKSSCR